MDQIYENMDYELSQTSGKEKRPGSDVSDCVDLSVRESNPPSSRETLKFLLAALGFLLLCSLVVLCVLGFLYSNERGSFEALSEKLSMQKHNYTELKSHLDKVQIDYENVSKRLDSFKVLKSHLDQVQMNYESAAKCLETFKEDCQKRALCGEGWRFFGVKCYYFSTDKLNWVNSQDHCSQKGGRLVIITSEAEQKFLYFTIGQTHWIGLNDLETEGKWMWVNNQPLTETGIEFWFKREAGRDEPDNWTTLDPTGENCAALGDASGNTHVWFDDSCSAHKKYICEK